jgi:hypothetical protein
MSKMENIVLQPTPEIEKACDLLELFIKRVLDARDTFPPLGEYESCDESLLLLYLIIRNIEAISALAKKDLILLPSAMNITRSVFEMAIKILWILAPQDVFEREVRWLAQLQTEEQYYDRISQRLGKLGIDNTDIIKIRDEISGFRLGVTKALPQEYKPLSKIPDFAAMLSAINEEQKYMTYIFLSQYSHGTHKATGLYRKGLGTKKEFGEFIKPKDWGVVISVCWYCLAKTSERIFIVIGGDAKRFLIDDFVQEIQGVIQKIETT